MEAAGLVRRAESPGDRRGKLVRLTPLGEQTAVRAARVHLENIKRYFVEPLPAADRERFAEDLRILSHDGPGRVAPSSLTCGPAAAQV